jgi:hypothetical protein
MRSTSRKRTREVNNKVKKEPKVIVEYPEVVTKGLFGAVNLNETIEKRDAVGYFGPKGDLVVISRYRPTPDGNLYDMAKCEVVKNLAIKQSVDSVAMKYESVDPNDLRSIHCCEN